MTDLYAIIHSIVYRGDEVVIPSGMEPDLIAAARANNPDALVSLLRGYASLVRKMLKTAPDLEDDEMVSAVLEAVSEALATTTGASLAETLPVALREALAASSRQQVVYAVPQRSLSRYRGIWKRAGRDLKTALDICQDYHMTRETFLAIHEAHGQTEVLYEDAYEVVLETPEPVDERTEELVAIALGALYPIEERVIMNRYGFFDYGEVQTPEAVAYKMGTTKRHVCRAERAAFPRMREALGITDLQEEINELERETSQ